MEEFMIRGVKPHARRIDCIWQHGGIPVVLFEAIPSARAIFEKVASFGERGACGDVFGFTPERAAFVFASAPSIHRFVTAPAVDGQQRMVFFARRAFFLINHSKERGFWLAPGSAGLEELSALS